MAEYTPKQLAKLQLEDAADAARVQAWFEEECNRYRPLWTARLETLRKASNHTGNPRTTEEYGKVIAENAKNDLQNLNNEIASMMVRSSIIVAAATLLFAVLALKPSNAHSQQAQVGIALLIMALAMTSVAIVVSLRSLTPPIRRAWFDKYEKRACFTLLVTDDFTSWVMACWLGDRRARVITNYKRAHSVAVPLLLLSGLVVIPALGLSIISH